MTLPYEDDFSSDPLTLAARHMANVTGMAVEAEQVADEAASNRIRRDQLASMVLARSFAAVAAAEQLARIADALDKIAAKEER